MSSFQSPMHPHWNYPPADRHDMDLIRQVNYELEFDLDNNNGMLDVYDVSMLRPEDEQRSLWMMFPGAYRTFLKCFLYRFELYIDVHDIIVIDPRNYSFDRESI
jgi:hypothetical protein